MRPTLVYAIRDRETSRLLDTNGEIFDGKDRRKSVRFHGRKSDAAQVLRRMKGREGLDIVEFLLYGNGDIAE